MLSRHAKEIDEDVDNIHKDACAMPLLLKYDRLEKKCIQKYIETKIVFIGNKITLLAFIFAELSIIVAIMISMSLILYPGYHRNFNQLYTVALAILFIFSIILVCLYIKVLFEKKVLKELIIAIEDDDKLTTKRQEENTGILEQDDDNSNMTIPSNKSGSGASSISNKTDTTVVQQKFRLLLDEHRWTTNLIWNKINVFIIANGLLFSTFNLLDMNGVAEIFHAQKISLIAVGLFLSVVWFFVLDHSINSKDCYKNQILDIQHDYPDLSINFIDHHPSWSGMFGAGTVATIATIGVFMGWVALLHFFM